MPAVTLEGERADVSRMAKLFIDLLNIEESQILVVAVAPSLERLTSSVKARLTSTEGGAFIVPSGQTDATERKKSLQRCAHMNILENQEIGKKIRALIVDTAGLAPLEVALSTRKVLLRDCESDSGKTLEEEEEEIIGHSEVLQLFEESIVWPREYPHIYKHFYPSIGVGINAQWVRVWSLDYCYTAPQEQVKRTLREY